MILSTGKNLNKRFTDQPPAGRLVRQNNKMGPSASPTPFCCRKLRRFAPRNDNPCGFTLIELMLVVLVLGLLLLAALPQFQGTYENLKARTLARDLHTLLLYAQERAILDRQIYRLNYFPKEKKVRLEKKEKKTYQAVTGRRGKPLKFEEPISIDWSTRSNVVEFGPQGESEKAEIKVLLDRKKRFIVRVGEPLGRIAFEEID